MTPPIVVGAASAVAAFLVVGGASGVVAASIVGAIVVLTLDRLDRQHRLNISKNRRNPALVADRSTPLTVDLLAAVLRSGQPLSVALGLVADVGEPPLAVSLEQVGRLLQLGADPATAWARVSDDPTLAEIARSAIRSAESGIRLADDFEQLATELRSRRRSVAAARAARAEVWSIAPLGLCFLPAFVCLGIAPIVVGVAHDVFGQIGR
ncbi:type II secretion system F family protein [Jatrophihabitans sp. GAS493]|uniref:type II secretion system F family protein n=1 Tax=Jatrophihabitans sp. GAS493 TaxID=1907575 RepID=UPI0012FE2FCC|nr:type II secretion system F family protein [Jatrophihabitans sp. GAS493]